jgi:AcrR family transcriptional regulator
MSSEAGGAERYLERTLTMIDGAGGSHGVNLRELSRALGCAHTNTYNYFEGLDALLSEALVTAVERQLAHAEAALAAAGVDPEERLQALIDSQIDFALAHPGWYRFVWLEPLRRPPPERAQAAMQRAGEGLVDLVARASDGTLPEGAAWQVAEDLHTYLHGALCKAIAGRIAPAPDDQLRARISSASRRVLRGFLESQEEG